MRVELLERKQVESIDSLQWQQLANNSVYTNPFYESWNLLSALKFLDKNANVYVATAYKNDQLIALFPVKVIKHKIGIRYLSIWKHEHCFLTDPLCSHPKELAKIINRVIRQLKVMIARFDHHSLYSYGRYVDQHSVVFRASRGAIFDTKNTREYLLTMPRKIRLENKRIAKRFSAKTEAVYETSDTKEKFDWLDAYCHLEHSGWKKSVSGSILSEPNTYQYYLGLQRAAEPLGKIQFQGFFNQQGALAISFRIVSNKRAFELKTSYNEKYKELYPGVNLEIKNMQELESNDYEFVDSCTVSENYLINRLWPNQRQIYTSLYFHGGILGKLLKLVYRFKSRHKSLS